MPGSDTAAAAAIFSHVPFSSFLRCYYCLFISIFPLPLLRTIDLELSYPYQYDRRSGQFIVCNHITISNNTTKVQQTTLTLFRFEDIQSR